MEYVCCGFGARLCLHDISEKLEKEIQELILKKGVKRFYTSATSEFDAEFIRAVLKAKKKYQDISIFLIKSALYTPPVSYRFDYDDIIIFDSNKPTTSDSFEKDIGFWMVENSHYVISQHNMTAGYYSAAKYAYSIGKPIFILDEEVVLI